VLLVRGVMVIKGFLTRLFLMLGHALRAVGRALLMPILVRVYGVTQRLRKKFQPAERRILLVLTHRGILHAAVIGIALTTAGGNIYAQGRSTVATGESSVVFQFLTGGDQTTEETGLPSLTEQHYLSDSVAADPTSTDSTDSLGDQNVDEGSEALTELGALMPGQTGSTNAVHRSQTEEYVVQSGDTLSGIADKFGVSIATILWENKLTPRDFIQPGQKLIILPSTGITYVVKGGDTLARIAGNYNVTTDDIISWNPVAATSIAKGDTLFIPNGRIAPPPAPSPRVKPLASPGDIFTAPVTRPIPPDAAPSAGNPDDLLWPTSSHRISQYYGHWRRSTGRHTGIDIANNTGEPIYAADDGIVTHAGCGTSCRRGYGYYVDIDHGDGVATRYGHMSRVIANVGEQVHRGQVVGLIGNTGNSTGPHLHFEVRINGRHVNPLPYVQ